MKRVTDRLLGSARTLEAGCRTGRPARCRTRFSASHEVLRDLHLEIAGARSRAAKTPALGPRLLHVRLRKRSRATLVAPR